MNNYNSSERYTPTKQDIDSNRNLLVALKNRIKNKRLTFIEQNETLQQIESLEWWLNIWG